MRYTSGTLPTSYGYTGQRADAATGLDYYHARYYDPIAGQFTSADTTLAGGLNRYAYVGGNPETFVDPTGNHAQSCDLALCGGEGINLDGSLSSAQGGALGDAIGSGGSSGSRGAGSGESTGETQASASAGDEVLAGETFSVDPVGDGTPQGWETQETNHLAQEAQAEAHTDASNKGDPPQSGNHDVSPASAQYRGGTTGTEGPGISNTAGLGKLSGVQIHVSPEGLSMVETHLSNAFFDQAPENAAMIDRLRISMENNEPVTGADASFYLHEVTEYNLMKDAPYTQEAYKAAHEAALDKYGVSRFSVYHPDVISSYPENFNGFWTSFWGL